MSIVKLIICTLISVGYLFIVDYIWYAVIWNSGPEDMEIQMQWMVLGYFILGLVFAYMYPKGVETDNPIREGLRYGILVALLVNVSQSFMWLAMPGMLVEPESLTNVIINSVFHIAQLGILGVVVAYLNQAGPGAKQGSKRESSATGGSDQDKRSTATG